MPDLELRGSGVRLLSRLIHRLLFVRHCLFIYVDDLIALLSLVCILLLILRVPMSWHKAYLGDRPLGSAGRCASTPCLLPWNLPTQTAFATCSPRSDPPVRSQKWALFRSALSVLLSDVGLASCPTSSKLLSVPGKDVSTLAEVPVSFPGGRRTWISVQMPAESDRKLSKESLAVLSMWNSCLADSCPIFPLPLAREFPCEAYADACADSSHAGIGGGFVKLPSGKCAWFRQHFSVRDLAPCVPGLPLIPRRKLASPLGNCLGKWPCFGLWPSSFRLDPTRSMLSPAVTTLRRIPLLWKGLPTARGLCSLLPAYFAWQRLFCISTYIDHVPGFRNTVADALSRGVDPASLGLATSDEVTVPWSLLSNLPRPSYSPSSALNTSLFPAMDF